METKVDELEKASEAANHENGKLRAQVDRITTELNQYKQRVSVMTQHKAIPREKVPFGNAALNNLSDVSFQFEFPKFGALPGPPMKQPSSQPLSPQQNGQKNSPARSLGSDSKSPQSGVRQSNQDDFAKYAGIFAPSMGNSTRTGSRASVDSVPFSVAAATSSPSASSNSNVGPSSSCGTSPEPFTQSPMSFKPLETLTTIGEEQPNTVTADQPFAQFSNVDIGSPSFDWLVQQNGGGQFDPQLFTEYREPQENVLANPSFDDFFFNDGLDADFLTPYNAAAPKEQAPKKNLIAQIDAQQEAIDEDKKDSMSCNQLWYVHINIQPLDKLYLQVAIGRNCKIVRRPKAASSIWMVFALNLQRRPSAQAVAQSLAKEISTQFSKSTWAKMYQRIAWPLSSAFRSTQRNLTV